MISDVSLNDKALVRKEFKERVRLFVQVSALKSVAETSIARHVSSLISGSSGVVAGFNALSDEPDLSSFYLSCSHPLVFPKLIAIPESDEMQFTRVENYSSEKWDMNFLGFKHPSSVEVVPAHDIQFMLIPGLGFSAFGERLGRGKGFYDRYLSNFKGLKIGVCFDCQWSEVNLPTDIWDIKMDYIVTETRCLKIQP